MHMRISFPEENATQHYEECLIYDESVCHIIYVIYNHFNSHFFLQVITNQNVFYSAIVVIRMDIPIIPAIYPIGSV